MGTLRYFFSFLTMSKSTKQPKKTETEAPGACSSTCLASITGLLVEHRAHIASDLETIHTTMREHEQRIVSLEDGAVSSDQRNWGIGGKVCNIRIVGLPESIEGPRPTVFFAELLVELLGNETLPSPPELDQAHRGLTTKL